MDARLAAWLLAPSLLSLACAEEDDSADQVDFVSDAEVIEAAAAHTETMTRINVDPILSTHDGEPEVNIWVNPAGEEEFRSLEPQVSQPELHFPTQTMIVKEIHGADGEIAMYAILYKQPAGYAADAGDWWWAVVDPNFEVVDDLVGNGDSVAFCSECHAAPATHASSDFVVGIDAVNQTP